MENIDGSCVQIRIVQTSACAGCNARIHCTSADSKEKLVEVCMRDSSSYHVGDSVCVVGEWSMGLKAVSLAFVFPFLILLATLSILVSMECGELVSALVSLTLLIPYYYIYVYACVEVLRGLRDAQASFHPLPPKELPQEETTPEGQLHGHGKPYAWQSIMGSQQCGKREAHQPHGA